jgi:beta-phosphoglucomutase-like phosphatase (HAD superfamily)
MAIRDRFDLGPLMRHQAANAARLIDGAAVAVEALRAEGVKVGSSTGYTRDMMAPVLREAAAEKSLLAAGADVVIDTVARLMPALRSAS